MNVSAAGRPLGSTGVKAAGVAGVAAVAATVALHNTEANDQGALLRLLIAHTSLYLAAAATLVSTLDSATGADDGAVSVAGVGASLQKDNSKNKGGRER